MAKLADLLGTVDIEVPIGRHTVAVTYRLAERTMKASDKLETENVAEAAVRLIESWDLEGTDGQTLALDVESLGGVPIPVLGRIIDAILKDPGLGEVSSDSDAG